MKKTDARGSRRQPPSCTSRSSPPSRNSSCRRAAVYKTAVNSGDLFATEVHRPLAFARSAKLTSAGCRSSRSFVDRILLAPIAAVRSHFGAEAKAAYARNHAAVSCFGDCHLSSFRAIAKLRRSVGSARVRARKIGGKTSLCAADAASAQLEIC